MHWMALTHTMTRHHQHHHHHYLAQKRIIALRNFALKVVVIIAAISRITGEEAPVPVYKAVKVSLSQSQKESVTAAASTPSVRERRFLAHP